MNTNLYIRGLVPTGKYLPSPKYKHKQCGEYLNDNFLKTRQISSSWASKKSLVDRFGYKKELMNFEVGDCVMMDYGTAAGHITMINTISDNRKVLTFTDCNRKGLGVVDNDFIVTVGDSNWQKIYGFARLKLNAKTQAAQPKKEIVEIPAWGKEAADKAKKKGIITDWSDPFEPIANERVEWIFEKVGLLDPTQHSGSVTLIEFAAILDRLGKL